MADAAVADFFSGWAVYRAVIDSDAMEHRRIYAEVAEILASRARPFAVLDLGCGDSAGMAPIVLAERDCSYVGVDCAAPALDYARRQLAGARERVEFVTADMSDYLRSADRLFDVVVVSFALHHLDTEAKRRFLSALQSVLAPGGEVLLIDVVRLDGESRSDYIDRYCAYVSEWHVDGDVRTRVQRHLIDHDFPEEVSAMAGLAQEAGFTVAEFYRGGNGTQAAWRLLA